MPDNLFLLVLFMKSFGKTDHIAVHSSCPIEGHQLVVLQECFVFIISLKPPPKAVL